MNTQKPICATFCNLTVLLQVIYGGYGWVGMGKDGEGWVRMGKDGWGWVRMGRDGYSV